jgi:cytochrome P450 family 6
VSFSDGFETSSTTISFCLYELSLNQDIQKHIREEIKVVLQKYSGSTYEAIQEMK